jgi:hypothetical protein
MKRNTKTEYSLEQDVISVKTSTIVELKEYFILQTQEKPIDIVTTIKCDLVNIPEKYHEIVLNMLTSKYLNKVSFGDNPFSECKPLLKRKWWQFWKSEYFTN